MANEKVVYYVDGSKASVRTLMIDQIMVERDALWRGAEAENHAIEMATRAVHHALVRSGQVFDKYEPWILTVEEVDIPDDAEAVKADPPEVSSDSVPQSP